jgi:hypothetical protein
MAMQASSATRCRTDIGSRFETLTMNCGNQATSQLFAVYSPPAAILVKLGFHNNYPVSLGRCGQAPEFGQSVAIECLIRRAGFYLIDLHHQLTLDSHLLWSDPQGTPKTGH